MPSLSLVIPLFNERRRIAKTFAALEPFLTRNAFASVEAVFVDDGSTDGTAELVNTFARTHPNVRLVRYEKNRGKGHAVKTGMLAATGDYRLTLDADMSTSLDMLTRFIPLMEQNAPVIIGTRKADGTSVTKPQAWHRQAMGKVYTILANLITQARVSDFTCGFKCFRADAATRIFSASRIDRWSYDAEILFLARQFGFSITEVRVAWANDADTRVRLGSDVWQSFADLLRIRFHRY